MYFHFYVCVYHIRVIIAGNSASSLDSDRRKFNVRSTFRSGSGIRRCFAPGLLKLLLQTFHEDFEIERNSSENL